MPLDGDREPFPVVETPFNEMAGQFSPAGGLLAYESNSSGRLDVFVRSFPRPSSSWRVSPHGGSQARWSHDGKELFFVATDGRMMAVPIQFDAVGQMRAPGSPVPLFQTRLATGANIPPAVGSKQQYAVAADGRFLMNVSVDGAPAPPITVVLDWRATLKR
jgi:Tol biopolymer transport system component